MGGFGIGMRGLGSFKRVSRTRRRSIWRAAWGHSVFRVSLLVVSGECKNGIFYSGFGVRSFGSGDWGLKGLGS